MPRILLLLLLAALLSGALSFLGLGPPPESDILGVVRGSEGPLEGARVRLTGHPRFLTTDAQGVFRLPRLAEEGRITAAHPDYFITGAKVDRRTRIQLPPLPSEDNERYVWVGPDPDPAHPGNCGHCHQAIYQEWSQSAHSRSASNPQFRDLYQGTDPGWSLLQDRPEGAAVCAACHAPTKEADGRGFEMHAVRDVAVRGVHCDFCHKVQGPGAGVWGHAHGRYNLTLRRPQEGQLFFGPLDDVDRGEDVYSPFQRDSRFCAACHEGVVFGVSVYTTYSEWLRSPAAASGQSCQSCHMAPTGRVTNIAPGRGGRDRDPFTLGNHRFFLESRKTMWNRAISLKIEVQGPEVVITVNPHGVGHRVPTGFVDRQVLLVVEARDATGQALPPLRGPRLPSLVGIRRAGQSGQLYARILHDSEGRFPVPFWASHPETTDTRLEPGQIQHTTFVYRERPASVRAQLLHRRFWDEVRRRKGWEDDEELMTEVRWPPSVVSNDPGVSR